MMDPEALLFSLRVIEPGCLRNWDDLVGREGSDGKDGGVVADGLFNSRGDRGLAGRGCATCSFFVAGDRETNSPKMVSNSSTDASGLGRLLVDALNDGLWRLAAVVALVLVSPLCWVASSTS